MNDLIKLAEARGWTALDLKLTGYWMPPGVTIHTHVMHIERVAESDLPDPFTDANHDHAVLGWARNKSGPFWSDFKDALFALHQQRDRDWMSHDRCHAWNYQIGDNANAALKVIADQGASVS